MVDQTVPSGRISLNTVVLLALLCLICILVAAIGVLAYGVFSAPPAYHPTAAPVYYPSFTPYPTSNVVQKFYIDRDLIIEPGLYQSLDYRLPGGVTYRISASTNGTPVNILVLDQKNFIEYQQAVGHDNDKWHALAFISAVVDGSFTYTTPSDDHYYFVWANNVGSADGMGGRQAVSVYVSVAE